MQKKVISTSIIGLVLIVGIYLFLFQGLLNITGNVISSSDLETSECDICGDGLMNLCNLEECQGLGDCTFTETLVSGTCINSQLALMGSYTAISTCEELQEINLNLTGNYILINNINCSDTTNWNDGKGFDPIGDGKVVHTNGGNTMSLPNAFSGTLEGNGFNIENLYINRSENNVGLFSGATDGAIIKNLSLVNVDIKGKENTGALIGNAFACNSGNFITNVYQSSVTGNVQGGRNTGGLIGHYAYCGKDYGVIEESYSEANVYGQGDNVGGLIGHINGARTKIQNSYATGDVVGTGWFTGGLVGRSWGCGWSQCSYFIQNSYATGDVKGVINGNTGKYVGGLVGGAGSIHINNSFSTGNVSGGYGIGAMFGSFNYGTSTNNYFNNHSSNPDNCGASNCIAIDNDEDYFKDKNNKPMSGWDFDNVWEEVAGSYPLLRFVCNQNPYLCPSHVEINLNEGGQRGPFTNTLLSFYYNYSRGGVEKSKGIRIDVIEPVDLPRSYFSDVSLSDYGAVIHFPLDAYFHEVKAIVTLSNFNVAEEDRDKLKFYEYDDDFIHARIVDREVLEYEPLKYVQDGFSGSFAGICGNGIDEGEECDDENSDNTDSCTNECLYARCGDGIVQPLGADGQNGLYDTIYWEDDEECDYNGTSPWDNFTKHHCTKPNQENECKCEAGYVLENGICVYHPIDYVDFYVSDIETGIPANVLVDHDNFFTWQDLTLKISSTLEVCNGEVVFEIYNPAFDTTSVLYDEDRLRDGCDSDDFGVTECDVICDSSGADYHCKLNGKYTRLGDTIKVNFSINSSNDEECEERVSGEIELGSCPYDSICKGNTPEEDSYFNHNPKGYPSLFAQAQGHLSCTLFEVCNPALDKYVDVAESQSICIAITNELSYRACLKDYAVEMGLGPEKRWMQGYWQQEIKFGDIVEKAEASNSLPVPSSKCKIGFWIFGHYLNDRCNFFESDYISSEVFNQPWSSNTNFNSNNAYFYDLNVLGNFIVGTGTCSDYANTLFTILRKMGYAHEEVFSASSAPRQNEGGHAYNLVKEPSGKYKIIDTTSNADQSSIVPTWKKSNWFQSIFGDDRWWVYCDMNILESENGQDLKDFNWISENVEGCECTGNVQWKYGKAEYAENQTNEKAMCCYQNEGLALYENEPHYCCNQGEDIIYGRAGTIYEQNGAKETSKCCSPNMNLDWSIRGKDISCCSPNSEVRWGKPGTRYAKDGELPSSRCCILGYDTYYSTDGNTIACCAPSKIAKWGQPGSYYAEDGLSADYLCCNPSSTPTYNTDQNNPGKILTC
jgi:hypothetical protein